jgi:hypothetical protein
MARRHCTFGAAPSRRHIPAIPHIDQRPSRIKVSVERRELPLASCFDPSPPLERRTVASPNFSLYYAEGAPDVSDHPALLRKRVWLKMSSDAKGKQAF